MYWNIYICVKAAAHIIEMHWIMIHKHAEYSTEKNDTTKKAADGPTIECILIQSSIFYAYYIYTVDHSYRVETLELPGYLSVLCIPGAWPCISY